ncbi:MAG TPA: hypothetical protein VK901_14615 [Nitrospiraceae bacterium]|nr:hypothetical protein [Nitrospiraceae bacterium]
MTALRPTCRPIAVWGPFLLSLTILNGGCGSFFDRPRHHDEVRSQETAVEKGPLPTPPVSAHKLEFDDPQDGARIKPKDRTEVPTVNNRTEPGAGLPSLSEMKEQALSNTKVLSLLGTRYTFISSTILDSGYKQPSGCCAMTPQKSRLTFYSYSNKATVDVEMKALAVTQVSRRENYLPLEGEEELTEAIALARKDSRIATGVQQLDGHAILTQPGDGLLWNDPGYGHRVYWVTFSKGLSGNPEYWAVVDLTEQKILKAQKEEAHP